MKKLLSAVLLTALLVGASGCESKNEHGECVGISDEKNPALNYKVSAWNVVMGIIFIETVFVPVIVVLSDLECPTGPKTPAAK